MKILLAAQCCSSGPVGTGLLSRDTVHELEFHQQATAGGCCHLVRLTRVCIRTCEKGINLAARLAAAVVLRGFLIF
jgi:hypothetical protein